MLCGCLQSLAGHPAEHRSSPVEQECISLHKKEEEKGSLDDPHLLFQRGSVLSMYEKTHLARMRARLRELTHAQSLNMTL